MKILNNIILAGLFLGAVSLHGARLDKSDHQIQQKIDKMKHEIHQYIEASYSLIDQYEDQMRRRLKKQSWVTNDKKVLQELKQKLLNRLYAVVANNAISTNSTDNIKHEINKLLSEHYSKIDESKDPIRKKNSQYQSLFGKFLKVNEDIAKQMVDGAGEVREPIRGIEVVG